MNIRNLLVVAAILSFPAVSIAEEINWRTDLGAAIKESVEQKKPIMLHFSADWCGPCKQLEKFVFPKDEVAKAINGSVIPVAVNVDNSQDISKRYNVSSVPHDVFLTSAGYVLLSRGAAGVGPEEYITTVGAVKKLAESQDALATGSLNTAPPTAELAEFTGEVRQQSHEVAANTRDGVKNLVNPATGAVTNVGDIVENAARDKYNTDDRYLPQRAGRDFKPRSKPAASLQAQAKEGSNQFVAANANRFSNAVTPPKEELQSFGNVVANPFINSGNRSPINRAKRKPRSSTPPAARQPAASSAPTANSGLTKQTATPSADQVAAIDKDAPALDGYCPVTLQKERKWKKGDEQWGCFHRGKLFLFTSEANRDGFMQDPDKYAPALVGYDPVIYAETGKLVGGKREIGVFYPASNPKIYVFSTPESKEKFQKTPELFSDKVRVATQECDTLRTRR